MSQHRTLRADSPQRENISVTLNGHAGRLRGKRQASFGRDAWLDESYVSRLLAGERIRPSRDTLPASALRLDILVEELDEPLLAAENRPMVLPSTLR